MIENADLLLEGFFDSCARLGLYEIQPSIHHEVLRAPHLQPGRLPIGYAAAYVFSLGIEYGATCPAGPNRVLKVGKVGANSSARFSSQHYQPHSAGSNLAKSLINEQVLWPYLGISELDDQNVKTWMLKNLERDHYFVPMAFKGVERELERYLRGWLGPVFEG